MSRVTVYRPSEQFELTTNSLGAHMKVTGSSPGIGSRWAHFEDIYLAHNVLTRWDHSEHAVSFPWVCNSHSEPTATTAWWVISWFHECLTASSRWEFEVFWSYLFFSVANDKHIQANSLKAHSNLTLWVIRWALCEYGVSSHLHWVVLLQKVEILLFRVIRCS